MHPFQVKIEFTKKPKCAELFFAGFMLELIKTQNAVDLKNK